MNGWGVLSLLRKQTITAIMQRNSFNGHSLRTVSPAGRDNTLMNGRKWTHFWSLTPLTIFLSFCCERTGPLIHPVHKSWKIHKLKLETILEQEKKYKYVLSTYPLILYIKENETRYNWREHLNKKENARNQHRPHGPLINLAHKSGETNILQWKRTATQEKRLIVSYSRSLTPFFPLSLPPEKQDILTEENVIMKKV